MTPEMTGLVSAFESPAFLFTFAVIQAGVLLVLVRALDTYGRQPLGLVALVAAWGATGAAGLSVVGNAFVRGLLDGDVAIVFGNAISAPLVEETAKGLALLAAVGPVRIVLRRAGVSLFEGAAAGIVYGAAVGLGFGFTEDIYYLVDTARTVGFDAGVDTFLYRRDFFGPAILHHAIFTGAFGAGLGLATWSTSRLQRILYPLGGFAFAVLMHAANNGLVELVLTVKYGLAETAAWVGNPTLVPAMADTASLMRRLMRMIDFFYVAGFFGAIIAWTLRQRDLIRVEVDDEVERGLLRSSDLALMFNPGERRSADWRLLRSGQFEHLRHQRRLRSQVAQLGLLKSRATRYGGDESRINRARREIATLSTYQVAPTKLPEPSSPLIGRDRELAAIGAVLDGDARVVTLLGPGGTGKTRLSIEAAFARRHRYAAGVYFVDLAPLTDPSLVMRTIADVLEVPTRPGESILDALGDHLRDKQLLLVLDNLEQVTEAANDLATLLRAAGRVTILATSRQPLGISGEHELPVPPLALPAPGRLGAVVTVGAIPAVALFVERALAADPDFRLTDANAAAVVEICRALDGLPLAIELAAARAGVLTPETILGRLGGQLGMLSGGARDLPERHQALRSTIDWSYDLLAPTERALFTHLGVFVDGADLPAVEAVCPEDSALDALTSLRDKSLVRRVDGEDAAPRFVMLQTIREYALDHLRSDGELAGARERHADHFASLAEQAEQNLIGADQGIWVTRLDREVGNLRAALQWSEESGRLATGLRLAGALARFWSMRGLTDPSDWIARVLRLGGDVPPAVRAKALFADGYAALDHGDLVRAESCFEESVAIYRELGEPHGVAAGRAQLAFLLMSRGETDQAVILAEQSAAGARDLGDANLESVALSTVADGAARQRDFARATSLYQRSLKLREQAGDRRNIANGMLNLGRVALTAGEHETARQLLEQGLGLARDVADSWSISVGLASLGRLDLATGRTASAVPLLQDALRRATDRGGQRLAVECLNALALAAVDSDPRQAALLLGAAEARRRALGVTLSPVEISGTEGVGTRVRVALGKDMFDARWTLGLTVDDEELLASEVAEVPAALDLVSAKDARKVAAVLMDAIGSATSVKIALVGDPVAFPGGWLFEHAPRSRDVAPAPIGPIVVLASGSVEVLDPAIPIATHLARRS